jgi:hypothetical protein
MRKEARLLLDKAVNSLILSVEHFNRPSDQGRVEAVLILLDHSLEMLLKAALLHRGARIREQRAKQTIGFDACVRKGLTDGKAKFLSQEQTLTLQSINGLRDAAQHHLLSISEQHLYIQAQAGLTLFKDLLADVFGRKLRDEFPDRVLPISTSPPIDLDALFEQETQTIRELLKPGIRRHTEAESKLRALAILEGAVSGENVQPGQPELRRISKQLGAGKRWTDVFPGVASIRLTTKGHGPSIDLRITKKEGIPVQLVPEGTPGASVVAVKRVNELDFFSLGRDQIAKKAGLSGPKATALIRHLKLEEDKECFSEISIGRVFFKRYSQKAVQRVVEALKTISMDEVWDKYRPRRVKKNGSTR